MFLDKTIHRSAHMRSVSKFLISWFLLNQTSSHWHWAQSRRMHMKFSCFSYSKKTHSMAKMYEYFYFLLLFLAFWRIFCLLVQLQRIIFESEPFLRPTNETLSSCHPKQIILGISNFYAAINVHVFDCLLPCLVT